MKRISLLLAAMLVGCSGPTEIETPDSNGTEVVTQAPTPREVRAPRTNTDFQSAEYVESWNSGINEEISLLVSAPDPVELFGVVTSNYRVSVQDSEVLFGRKDVWDPAWVAYGPTDHLIDEVPSPMEAERLEAADQKWPAAQIYAAHGDYVSANRCAQKLFDEGSYKVAAMTAVLTGDTEMMTKATTVMVEARYITKTFDVIRYAIEQGRPQAARHIADTHGFDLLEVTDEYAVRQLAIAGDGSLLPPFIEANLRNWEAGGDLSHPHGAETIVADIAMLGRTDKEAARGYAARYLRLEHANVLIWVHCGEGCYASPMQGTLELYELIKHDSELKQLYLDRTRRFVDEAWPVPTLDEYGEVDDLPAQVIAGEHVGNMYGGWSTGMWGGDDIYPETSLLYTLLMNVRQSGDADLIRLWTELLDSFGQRSVEHFEGSTLAFEREMGRGILGQPVNTDAPDLTLIERYLLSNMLGRPAPDLSGLWQELEDPTSRTHSDTMHSLQWMVRMLLKGRVNDSARTQIVDRYSLNLAEDDSGEGRISSLFQVALKSKYGKSYSLEADLDRPWRAARTNQSALDQRAAMDLPQIDLYPASAEQAQELLAPHLQRLQTELPVHYARYMASRGE